MYFVMFVLYIQNYFVALLNEHYLQLSWTTLEKVNLMSVSYPPLGAQFWTRSTRSNPEGWKCSMNRWRADCTTSSWPLMEDTSQVQRKLMTICGPARLHRLALCLASPGCNRVPFRELFLTRHTGTAISQICAGCERICLLRWQAVHSPSMFLTPAKCRREAMGSALCSAVRRLNSSSLHPRRNYKIWTSASLVRWTSPSSLNIYFKANSCYNMTIVCKLVLYSFHYVEQLRMERRCCHQYRRRHCTTSWLHTLPDGLVRFISFYHFLFSVFLIFLLGILMFPTFALFFNILY